MKHHFGQYRFKVLKHASPNGDPNLLDPDEAATRIYKGLTSEEAKVYGVTRHDILNLLYQISAEHSIFLGGGVHLFIDPDTEAVIWNAIRKLETHEFEQYLPERGIGIIYRAGVPPCIYYSDVRSGDEKTSLLVANEEQGALSQVGFSKSDTMPTVERPTLGDDEYAGLKKSLRFTLGVFMMKECFPELFVDGLPAFVKHPTWYRKQKNYHLAVEKIERTVCPHIRRGHFRFLRSDRYVHAKGQVIFVKPSMVKGHAKHTEGFDAVKK